HRQVGGPRAFEDAIDVTRRASEWVDRVGAVRDQATAGDVATMPVDGRQSMPIRQRDNEVAMNERQCGCRHDQAAILRRANAVTARSISPASRRSTAVNSIPSDGATAWIAPNCPIPEATAGSRSTATRVTRGAISLSTSSHFPLMPYSKIMKPVALPPGSARLATKPAPTGSATVTNTIGIVRVAYSNGAAVAVPVPPMRTSGARATHSAACLRMSSALAQGVSIDQVAAVAPAQLLEGLHQRREAGLSFRIVRWQVHEHADAPHPLALLRPRREWPRGGRAAEQRDELATLHSITSSAVASRPAGMVRPSARAVLRLITSSNLVDCRTGRSAGLAPLRMRAV